MTKILSVIVSYNFEPWLKKCLNSLLDSEIATDILVIDNNSKDQTVFTIRQMYPQVRVIENHENLGFGKANNIGIQIALDEGYEYVFLVNQDAWINPDCITEMLKIPITPEIGIISPKHMDGTGLALDKGFEEYIKTAVPENNYYKVKFINAAFWMIPIPVIRKTGGFSPIFYHYGEDLDFVNRIHYFGYSVVYTDKAVAFHDRQERPYSESAFLKSEFVYFLTEYCNINYSFTKGFMMAIGASIQKMLKALMKKNWVFAKAYLSISWRLWIRTLDVIITRKNNKKRS